MGPCLQLTLYLTQLHGTTSMGLTVQRGDWKQPPGPLRDGTPDLQAVSAHPWPNYSLGPSEALQQGEGGTATEAPGVFPAV